MDETRPSDQGGEPPQPHPPPQPNPDHEEGGGTDSCSEDVTSSEESSGDGERRALQAAVDAVAPFARAFLAAATAAGKSIAQQQQQRRQQDLQGEEGDRESNDNMDHTTTEASSSSSGGDNQDPSSSSNSGSGSDEPEDEQHAHSGRRNSNSRSRQRLQQQLAAAAEASGSRLTQEEDRHSQSSGNSGSSNERTRSSGGYRNDAPDESETTSGQDNKGEDDDGDEEEEDEDDTDSGDTSSSAGSSGEGSFADDILFIVQEEDTAGVGVEAAGAAAAVARMPPQNQHEQRVDRQRRPAVHDGIAILGRLLEGHPPNHQFEGAIQELAQRYNEVKAGFRETAVEVLMRQVHKNGGRFRRKKPDGTSAPLEDWQTRRMLRKIFKNSCQKAVNSAEAREEREQQNQARKRDRDESSSGGGFQGKRQRRQNKSHMTVDFSTIEKHGFFAFGKNLSMNTDLESLQIYTAPMTMAAANAIATGLKKCKNLQQVKLQFTAEETLDGHLSALMEGIFENRSVQSINLNDSFLNGKACEFICNLFAEKPHNKIVRVSMENNPLGDAGAEALAKAVQESSSLRYLCLGNNGFTEHGIGLLNVAASRAGRLMEISGLSLLQQELLTNNQANEASRSRMSRSRAVSTRGSVCSSDVTSSIGDSQQSSSNSNQQSSSSSDENNVTAKSRNTAAREQERRSPSSGGGVIR